MNKKGFTLVEILLYIALVAVIITSITYFTWDVIYGGIKTYVMREVQQNARFSLERMTYEIEKAQGINSISDNELILDNGTAGPDVIFRFDDINNKITIQIGSGSEEDLTSEAIEVTNSYFYNRSYIYPGASEYATENVKIVMTLNYYNPDDLQEWLAQDTYETTVELKGK